MLKGDFIKLRLTKNKLLLILVVITGIYSTSVFASAYSLYQRAEKLQQRLLSNKGKKYRSNWIRVINAYMSVYRSYPHTRYAPCSLVKAGQLYIRLSRFSGKKGDGEKGRAILRVAYHKYKGRCIDEALYYAGRYDEENGLVINATKVYKLLLSKFPSSYWSKKARLRLSILSKSRRTSSSSSLHRNTKILFDKAENSYRTLIRTNQKQFRHNWFRVIRKFKKVIITSPSSYYALRSYIKIGFMYEQLYRYGLDKDDLREALKFYVEAYKKFPSQKESAKAIYLASRVCVKLREYRCAREKINLIIKRFRYTKFYKLAKKELMGIPKIEREEKAWKKQRSGKVVVKGVRYWSSNNYTRIVVYSDTPFVYEEHYLPEDKKHNKPPRFYFDIQNAVLSPEVPSQIAINDGLLRSARIGQFKKNVVRVVLDLQSVGRYTAFTLEDPFRLVIDVFGAKRRNVVRRRKLPISKSTNRKYVYLTRKLKIVIDPGHGGKDPGATCCGIKEKNITLAIALKLARLLRKRLGAEVVLTRYTDVFIPLEERTALANTENADVFVSIHVNSTPERHLSLSSAPSGAIVYYLGKARDFSARRVAMIENQSARTSSRKDWIGVLINELEKYYKRNDSIQLAQSIQKYLNSRAVFMNPYYKSHHIDGAPFYVLVNTSMPAVLVETGFINNPFEGRLLTDPKYQQIIAEAIYMGIKEFIEKYVVQTL